MSAKIQINISHPNPASLSDLMGNLSLMRGLMNLVEYGATVQFKMNGANYEFTNKVEEGVTPLDKDTIHPLLSEFMMLKMLATEKSQLFQGVNLFHSIHYTKASFSTDFFLLTAL